jgi:recombinational DNA repair protein RecR
MPFNLTNALVVFQHLMNNGFCEYLGVCSFSADASLLKNSCDSVKMVFYFDIINFMGNYMVVNEFLSPYENKTFKKKSLMHMLRKIKLKSTQKIMIWAYENMAHFRAFKSPY